MPVAWKKTFSKSWQPPEIKANQRKWKSCPISKPLKEINTLQLFKQKTIFYCDTLWESVDCSCASKPPVRAAGGVTQTHRSRYVYHPKPGLVWHCNWGSGLLWFLPSMPSIHRALERYALLECHFLIYRVFFMCELEDRSKGVSNPWDKYRTGLWGGSGPALSEFAGMIKVQL